MQKLTDEQVERLIDYVHQKPGLYEKSNKLYKKTDWREMAWKEIADSLNVDEKDCKTAWRSLRDQYQKNIKEIKGSTGQGYDINNRKRYKYSEKLHFLKDSLEPRATTCNFDVKQDSNDIFNADSWSDVEFLDEFPCSSNVLQPGQDHSNIRSTSQIPKSTTSTSTPAKRRREEHDDSANFKNFLQTIASQLTESGQKELDSIDNFFLSVASTVRAYNLSVSNMARLQSKVLNFVTDELENM